MPKSERRRNSLLLLGERSGYGMSLCTVVAGRGRRSVQIERRFAKSIKIPTDYHARLLNGRTLPSMILEGVWTFASVEQL